MKPKIFFFGQPSPADFKDGEHENLMKENNKLISINISLTNCRESNNHNVLIPTNTKFLNPNVYWCLKLSKKAKIKMSVENGSKSTLKDVMLTLASIKSTVDGINNRICKVEERLYKVEEKFAKWEI